MRGYSLMISTSFLKRRLKYHEIESKYPFFPPKSALNFKKKTYKQSHKHECPGVTLPSFNVSQNNQQ